MEKSKEVMFTALMLREALGSNLYQDKIFCGNSTTIGESTITRSALYKWKAKPSYTMVISFA